MNEKYSGYYAYIYKSDDAPSACLKGENMKKKFPGSDFEITDGEPCGLCSQVEGSNDKVAEQIKDWINSEG